MLFWGTKQKISQGILENYDVLENSQRINIVNICDIYVWTRITIIKMIAKSRTYRKKFSIDHKNNHFENDNNGHIWWWDCSSDIWGTAEGNEILIECSLWSESKTRIEINSNDFE